MLDATFDDRDGWVWHDGHLVPWRDAKVHVLTHALHYASAVFEGMRCYGGTVFALSQHSQRLIDSAKILGFTLPWSREEIDAAVNATVAANNLTDCYVRPIAWRGSEQMGVAAQKTKPHMAIAAWEWGAYFGEEALAKGLRLNVAQWRRPAPYTAPTRSKAAGLYMICTLSKHAATDAGYDDALMLDWRGQVAEATGANIFFVKDGALHTPTPDCFLDGITRRSVLALARDWGLAVEERPVSGLEIIEALTAGRLREAFGVGTAATIAPIAVIGHEGHDYELPAVPADAFSRRAGAALTAIRSGEAADPHGWMVAV